MSLQEWIKEHWEGDNRLLDKPTAIATDWEFIGLSTDGQPFLIGSLDVWSHEWRDTTERASIKDPRHQHDYTFWVYEMGNPDAAVTFAAGEFSMGMWGFYIRK